MKKEKLVSYMFIVLISMDIIIHVGIYIFSNQMPKTSYIVSFLVIISAFVIAVLYFKIRIESLQQVLLKGKTRERELFSCNKNLKEEKVELLKKIDNAKEYDKSKTEFFANLSHELRTPLNVILSALQMIEVYFNKEGKVIEKKDIEKYKIHIKQNCYRLLRLIGNLIDLTKAEGDFIILNLKPYNIIELIEDITLSVVDYANSKAMKIIFDTEIEERYIMCDPDKIERIMLNLLSNAIKFSNEGEEIKVSIFDKGSALEIHVKDNGIGIPADMKDKIFDRFKQVDKNLIKEHEGSGIGLSLVKAFLEMHSGTIHVESEYKKGSDFIINLPVIDRCLEESEVKELETKNPQIETVKIEFSDIYTKIS